MQKVISAESQQEAVAQQQQALLMSQKYQGIPKKHPNMLLNRRNTKTYFDSGDYHMARAKQPPMTAASQNNNSSVPPSENNQQKSQQSKLIESSNWPIVKLTKL